VTDPADAPFADRSRVTDPAVHARALPNDLAPAQLRVRPDKDGEVAVEPDQAAWRYLSFRALTLRSALSIPEGREVAVIVIAGGVAVEGPGFGPWRLPGRASPFDALPWACYLPARPVKSSGLLNCPMARLSPSGGETRVALAFAPPSGREGASTEPIVISPDEIAIEVRGAGNATRQINHIITPDFPADRLEVVEVFTPSGNWSSWPPHKHDTDDMPTEAVLEEVYYYEFRRPEAWGIQRLYRRDGTRDALWSVRHGEAVLVTDGYHPFVATHGDDAYYLNVLAGDRRTMACSFDPDLDWVRATWRDLPPDPRVPMVSGGRPAAS
jgi:5-deoxy-glucuronate isomerase